MTTTLIFFSIMAGIALIGVGSSVYLGDDNQVEEASEVYIKNKTGLDVDLSPNTPETKK